MNNKNSVCTGMCKKSKRLNLRIDQETYEMISVLKSKFSVNVSSLIRNHIRETYEKEIGHKNRQIVQ